MSRFFLLLPWSSTYSCSAVICITSSSFPPKIWQMHNFANGSCFMVTQLITLHWLLHVQNARTAFFSSGLFVAFHPALTIHCTTISHTNLESYVINSVLCFHSCMDVFLFMGQSALKLGWEAKTETGWSFSDFLLNRTSLYNAAECVKYSDVAAFRHCSCFSNLTTAAMLHPLNQYPQILDAATGE